MRVPNYRVKQKTILSVFLAVFQMCLAASAKESEQRSSSVSTTDEAPHASYGAKVLQQIKEEQDADVRREKEDPPLINRWYYEGCLTGCSHGFELGFAFGADQRRRGGISFLPEGPVLDWPESLRTTIDRELEDILSNEPREVDHYSHPQPDPRVIATARQLPIRHAGIYSTYYKAVRDGYSTGTHGRASDLIIETNKYLDNYALTNKPNIDPKLAKGILFKHRVEWTE
jgi:hypothetical protein